MVTKNAVSSDFSSAFANCFRLEPIRCDTEDRVSPDEFIKDTILSNIKYDYNNINIIIIYLDDNNIFNLEERLAMLYPCFIVFLICKINILILDRLYTVLYHNFTYFKAFSYIFIKGLQPHMKPMQVFTGFTCWYISCDFKGN